MNDPQTVGIVNAVLVDYRIEIVNDQHLPAQLNVASGRAFASLHATASTRPYLNGRRSGP